MLIHDVMSEFARPTAAAQSRRQGPSSTPQAGQAEPLAIWWFHMEVS